MIHKRTPTYPHTLHACTHAHLYAWRRVTALRASSLLSHLIANRNTSACHTCKAVRRAQKSGTEVCICLTIILS